jgi:molybdate transport system regulatory protein
MKVPTSLPSQRRVTYPSIRFRVDFGPKSCVGPGKIALLEQIGWGRSLSQAARELNMSYRRAWQLLDSLNSSFRTPATVSAIGGRRGGGTRLTPLGEQLIRAYRDFDEQMQQRAGTSFRWLNSRTNNRSCQEQKRRPVLGRRS